MVYNIGMVNVPGDNLGELEQVDPSTVAPGGAPQVAAESVQAAVEVVPSLELRLEAACSNPDGNYVGLSAAQRSRLGVEVGGTVELMDGSQSLGLFMVGKGLKVLQSQPDAFSANLADGFKGRSITVRKAPAKMEKDVSYMVSLGAEASERHERRKTVIAERFSDMDPEAYVTVPTALLKQMGVTPLPDSKKATALPISKGQLKIGDQMHTVVFVPSGEAIGFTTKAATQLNIPVSLFNLRVRVEEGVLVVA